MSRKRRRRGGSRGVVESNYESDLEARIDTFQHMPSGKGTNRDKLNGLNPNPNRIEPNEARDFYKSNGFIANIIDTPAKDCVREWIKISTNRDVDDRENGLEGLGINRLIENRLEEIGLRAKIKDHIRNSRLHHDGSLMYFGIVADVPQTDWVLGEPMPNLIHKLDFINVIEPDRFTVSPVSYDPLSKNYHSYKFRLGGIDVHSSRVNWLCNGYDKEEQRGVSMLEIILEGIYGQDVALWSTTTNLFESALKLYKSKSFDSADPKQVFDYMRLIRMAASSQSVIPLGPEDSFEKLGSTGFDTSIGAVLDFIFENLAGLARMPKSKILGQAQGAIESGAHDLISYYDDIYRYLEDEIRPIIEKAIHLVIHETSGDIYKALAGDVEGLDWKLEFKPLWRLTPKEEAENYLTYAQADQIYVTLTSVSPNEIRHKRFNDLEDFEEFEDEPSSLADFTSPELVTPNIFDAPKDDDKSLKSEDFKKRSGSILSGFGLGG